jgi:quercetin dioxygenase-like cupin family protein
MKIRNYLLVLLLTACASSAPNVPYPAFVQADDLEDVFLAGMPGILAKQFAGDPRSRRSSNRLQLPAGWKGSTGASPGKSVELFVVTGEITLGKMVMKAGSYAYIPPGFTGSSIETESGAFVLYFLDDPNPDAVIQTPLLMDSNVLDWQLASDAPEDFGFSVKELRMDPGSGVRVSLLRIEPGATQLWRQASKTEEGYLLSGHYRHSECVNGEVLTHDYLPGGYFARPGGAVHGGPESMAISSSVWYLRRLGKSDVQTVPPCESLPKNPSQ